MGPQTRNGINTQDNRGGTGTTQQGMMSALVKKIGELGELGDRLALKQASDKEDMKKAIKQAKAGHTKALSVIGAIMHKTDSVAEDIARNTAELMRVLAERPHTEHSGRRGIPDTPDMPSHLSPVIWSQDTGTNTTEQERRRRSGVAAPEERSYYNQWTKKQQEEWKKNNPLSITRTPPEPKQMTMPGASN